MSAGVGAHAERGAQRPNPVSAVFPLGDLRTVTRPQSSSAVRVGGLAPAREGGRGDCPRCCRQSAWRQTQLQRC